MVLPVSAVLEISLGLPDSDVRRRRKEEEEEDEVEWVYRSEA